MMINVAGGSTAYLNPQFNPCRTINMYSVVDPTSKWGSGLASWPGAVLSDTKVVNGNTRALYALESTNQNFMFAVIGNTLYNYNHVLVGSPIGNIGSSSGYVGIDSNLHQMIFVDSINGWVYDLITNTFTQITAPGFPADPVDVTYLDGRLIVAQGTTNRFYISDEEDATSWNSLNFGSLTTDPEVLVAIKEKKRRIFVFGKQTTEVWFNAGSPGFPFVRDNNMVYNFGCVSAYGLADGQDFLIWVSRELNGNPAIRLSDGGSIIKVSDDAIEKRLQALTNIADVQAYIQKINGHTFAVFSWTTDDLTLFYDTDTKLWHELQMSDESRYFACCHTYFGNKHYVGSFNTPTIHEISDDYLDNNGDNIHCVRILPPVKLDDMHQIEIGRAELDCITGFAPQDTPANHQDADPVVYMSTSLDGGVTFGEPVTAATGKVGVYQKRVIWPPLGIYEKGCVIKLEHFNKTKFIMMALDLMVRKLGY